MTNGSFSDVIREQTRRALWEVKNVITCIRDENWERPYCDAPLWQHVYHMLHSLDQWFINPSDPHFEEPDFHCRDLNNLDVRPPYALSRETLDAYCDAVFARIGAYTASLTDEMLLEKPEGCAFSRFTLVLGQFRHLNTHMGMLMGFQIADSGEWPYVLGLTRDEPETGFGTFC